MSSAEGDSTRRNVASNAGTTRPLSCTSGCEASGTPNHWALGFRLHSGLWLPVRSWLALRTGLRL